MNAGISDGFFSNPDWFVLAVFAVSLKLVWGDWADRDAARAVMGDKINPVRSSPKQSIH